jgi:hypothetical protein
MNDGHSGIGNRQVNEGGSEKFQLILAYIKQADGQGDFVIHATSNTYTFSGLQPLEFLADIGFTHFRGQCPFYQDKCYYRIIATLERDVRGFENHDQVHLLHHAFQSFADKIGNLYQLRKNEDNILREIGIEISGRQIFRSPVEIEIEDTDIPLWVQDVKFSRLVELENQVATLQKEIEMLSGYLHLICGTGDALDLAVIKALRLFGLKAEPATRGFTVDVLAQTSDGSRKFGFEITGLAGPIKKDSKKLTQVLDFERIKEGEEKTVLVANTYNSTPISERNKLEDFTQPVLDFLGRHPILLMTGWDLYCMVRNVLEGTHPKEEIIELLYNTTGKLDYQEFEAG